MPRFCRFCAPAFIRPMQAMISVWRSEESTVPIGRRRNEIVQHSLRYWKPILQEAGIFTAEAECDSDMRIVLLSAANEIPTSFFSRLQRLILQHGHDSAAVGIDQKDIVAEAREFILLSIRHLARGARG